MTPDGESAYEAAGVDYETLDAGKRNALTEALATSPALLSAPGGGRAVMSRAVSRRSCSKRADRRSRSWSRGSGPSR